MNRQTNKSTGILCMNLKSLFLSKGFYIAVAANFLVMLFEQIFQHGKFNLSADNLCYQFNTLIYYGLLPKTTLIIISAIPVIATFCNDWNTQYIRSVVGRTGIDRYLNHKIYFCFLGTFITSFVSLMLCTLFMLLKFPIISENGIMNLSGFYPIGCIIEKHPYLFQILKIFCLSLYYGFWSVAGLTVSAFIPNRFVVYTSPFIFSLTAEMFFDGVLSGIVPSFFQLPNIAFTTLTKPMFGNIIIDLLYIIFIFVGLSLLVGQLFIYQAKRRICNEVI